MRPEPIRLVPGAQAPRQQTQVTCGAACLAVARLSIDAGLTDRVAATRDGFAHLERRVHAWTNGVRGPGGLQLPWPRFWGTPPWSALAALEHGAAAPGTRYRVLPMRQASGPALGELHDRLLTAVAPGAPALLYVGSRLLPRHVVLIATGPGGGPVVYEPASGAVTRPDRASFAGRACRLGGWDVPWLALVPRS